MLTGEISQRLHPLLWCKRVDKICLPWQGNYGAWKSSFNLAIFIMSQSYISVFSNMSYYIMLTLFSFESKIATYRITAPPKQSIFLLSNLRITTPPTHSSFSFFIFFLFFLNFLLCCLKIMTILSLLSALCTLAILLCGLLNNYIHIIYLMRKPCFVTSMAWEQRRAESIMWTLEANSMIYVDALDTLLDSDASIVVFQ